MQKDHIHKLKRYKYPNKTTIFFCVLDCGFKVEVALAVGKRVLCNLCDQPFVMKEKHLRLVRPHCDRCSKKKVKDEDGKSYYIREGVMQEVAKSAVNDLSERLREVVDGSKEDI